MSLPPIRRQVVPREEELSRVPGDLADPHGTHKVCLDIIFEAMRRCKAATAAASCAAQAGRST